MNLVFFSHSYRSEDTRLNKYFADLAESEGLTLSLDPPSDSLNAAKLERHLNSCDAMLCVLTARSTGVSAYQRHEVRTCVRLRKPLWVFVEDTLRDDILPWIIPQRRFSRRFYIRQVREHRNAMRTLKGFLGEEAPARFLPFDARRRCLVIGGSLLNQSCRASALNLINQLGYEALDVEKLPLILNDEETSTRLAAAELIIAVMQSNPTAADFWAGFLAGSQIPKIVLSTDATYRLIDTFPSEYQARIIKPSPEAISAVIDREVAIYSHDLVDISDQQKVEEYTRMLIWASRTPGHYTSEVRNIIVQKLDVMRDKYEQGQGVQGPNAHAEGNVFVQGQQELKNIDYAALAQELAKVRKEIRQRSTDAPEADIAAGAVAQAETAANAKEPGKVLEALRSAGTWTLNIAKELGLKVAESAIEKSLGLG